MQNRRKSQKSQKQRGGKAKKYSKNKSKSRRTRSSRYGTNADANELKSAITLPNMGFYKNVFNAEEKKVPSMFRF